VSRAEDLCKLLGRVADWFPARLDREAIEHGLERLAGSFRGFGDQPRRDPVTGPERDAVFPRQRVSQLGQRDPPLSRAAGHSCGVELRRGERGRDQPQRANRVLEHLEDQRLQIVLGVDDVAEGRVVNRDQDRRRLTDGLAADRTRVLERDRVALLRHDAAALHEAVGQPQVAELCRAPEQEVLHHATEAGEEY
jgi:hypothetical protein